MGTTIAHLLFLWSSRSKIPTSHTTKPVDCTHEKGTICSCNVNLLFCSKKKMSNDLWEVGAFLRVIIRMVLLVCLWVLLPHHIIMHPPTPPLGSYSNLNEVKNLVKGAVVEPPLSPTWHCPHNPPCLFPQTFFKSPKSENLKLDLINSLTSTRKVRDSVLCFGG